MIPTTPDDRAAATAFRRAAALHLHRTSGDLDGMRAVLAELTTADGEAIGRMLIAQSQLMGEVTPTELRPVVTADLQGLLLACAAIEGTES